MLLLSSCVLAGPSFVPRQLQDEDDQLEQELRELQDLDEDEDDEDLGPDDFKNNLYWKSTHYQEQSRQEKLEELWNELVPDEEDYDVAPMDFYWKEFPNFFTQKSNGSFCQNSDGARPNRPKTTHTQGVVAKVEWVPVENDLGYTGIYDSGSDTVILRLSETNNLSEATTGLMPSMALKFLLNGRKSENILAMHSMKPTDSWNFFENPMSNRVEPFDPKEDFIEFQTVHKKMSEGSKCPYATATGGIARVNNQGVGLPKKAASTPYELEFVSPFKDALNEEDVAGEVWYKQLQKKIPKGSTIFEVYARTAPRDCNKEESRLVKIAEVNLLTDLYTSDFGDAGLYFQHRRVQTDYKLFPKTWKGHAWRAESCQWESNPWGESVPDTWPEDDEAAEKFYTKQMKATGCPFAWLLFN